MAIYRKSHLVQGMLAQASWLLKAGGISLPRRVAYLGLKKFHGPSELDASLGEFRVRKL